MADEESRSSGGSSFVRTFGMLVGVALVSAIAALLAYKMWLAPRLVDAQVQPSAVDDKIPELAQAVEFDESIVDVIDPNRNGPASLLLFRVSFLCSNPEAAELVTRDKAYFKEMIDDLHRYKNRAALDDPLCKESIKRQALRKANERLQKLQMQPKEDVKVIDVYHTKFFVADQL